MNDAEERNTHPSYGQILFSRTNGNADFYGSEFAQDHYITLEINQSELKRTLTKDWYFGTDTVARVRMSSNQFAELLTSLNQGSGVPCTIEVMGGKRVEEYPKPESRKEVIHRMFEDRMKQFSDTIREKQKQAKELVKKKTLSKQDIHDLTHHLEWLTGEVERNIPFFAKCFQENMDDVVLEAKSEIENAIQHKINTLGLQALHEQNQLLSNG